MIFCKFYNRVWSQDLVDNWRSGLPNDQAHMRAYLGGHG